LSSSSRTFGFGRFLGFAFFHRLSGGDGFGFDAVVEFLLKPQSVGVEVPHHIFADG
jgi:hypothetical protein